MVVFYTPFILLIAIMVGLVGKIIRTTDGGENWENQSSGTSDDLLSVHFTDENIGWAVGGGGTAPNSYGIVLKTTNGGTNWTILSSGITSFLRSVYFTDQNTGWTAGANYNNYQGKILKTTDGGANWIIQFSLFNPLNSIYFFNQNIGWVVGDGAILRTTNGGIDWINETGVTQSWLNSVHFKDEGIGWAVGYDFNGTTYGSILNTTDGGVNWISQLSELWLNSVYFITPYTGWAVGEFGTILKTTNGGITFIEGKINEIPNTYLLTQNYPNPFNPTTTIKYQIPGLSFITLKVYDVLGKELVTLISEEKSVGNYEVEFDGANLTSGIYFYQLKSGNFIETKKMLLIK